MVEQDKIREMLVAEEGLELKPYRCTAGKLTLGIGRNLDDVGISRDEAYFMLDNDIETCRRDLFGMLPNFETMPEGVQLAMIDMRFNLGPARFRGFRRMIAAVELGNWQAAARELALSNYARQVPKRAKRNGERILQTEETKA